MTVIPPSFPFFLVMSSLYSDFPSLLTMILLQLSSSEINSSIVFQHSKIRNSSFLNIVVANIYSPDLT